MSGSDNTEASPHVKINMEEGYVKLFRSLKNWQWKAVPEMVALWVDLLSYATFENTEWHREDLKPGQLVVGRKALAERTGLSEQQVRTCLLRLKRSGQISVKSTNKYSVITIINWGDYQDSESGANQQSTSNQPAINHIKESSISIDVTNSNNNKKKYGRYENVLLTEEQAEKLIADYDRETVSYAIAWFDATMEESVANKRKHGKRNHNLCLRRWAITASIEAKNRNGKALSDQQNLFANSGNYRSQKRTPGVNG